MDAFHGRRRMERLRLRHVEQTRRFPVQETRAGGLAALGRVAHAFKPRGRRRYRASSCVQEGRDRVLRLAQRVLEHGSEAFCRASCQVALPLASERDLFDLLLGLFQAGLAMGAQARRPRL